MKTTLLDTSNKEDHASHTTGGVCLQNHLELRLGISSYLSSGLEDMVTTTTTTTTNSTSYNKRQRALGQNHVLVVTTPDIHVQELKQSKGLGSFTKPSFNSFVHPWSLAARQQKAALEKAHLPPPTVPTRDIQHSQVPIVGWPPIRTFRRNSCGLQQLEINMDEETKTKRAKTTEEKDGSAKQLEGGTMFVKVNMEGYAVGRKIDLKAYDSYVSLSQGLQEMFNNFLSNGYYKNTENDEQGDEPTSNYLFIYEDQEGDRMLVGDVPWKMFINSVKRLYITKAQKSLTKADGRVVEEKK